MKKINAEKRTLSLRRKILNKRIQERLCGVSRSRKLLAKISTAAARRPIALSAPKVFDLRGHETRKEILGFLADIESALLAGRRIKLCFGREKPGTDHGFRDPIVPPSPTGSTSP